MDLVLHNICVYAFNVANIISYVRPHVFIDNVADGEIFILKYIMLNVGGITFFSSDRKYATDHSFSLLL